jgi:hypothetical protein
MSSLYVFQTSGMDIEAIICRIWILLEAYEINSPRVEISSGFDWGTRIRLEFDEAESAHTIARALNLDEAAAEPLSRSLGRQPRKAFELDFVRGCRKQP